MTAKRLRDLKVDATSVTQKLDEVIDMFGESILILTAQTDIQIVLLAHAPAVALQVLAKVKLRDFRLDRTILQLFIGQSEFGFLSEDNGCFLGRFGIELLGNWTEVASSAN